jgi:hypothetical protein
VATAREISGARSSGVQYGVGYALSDPSQPRGGSGDAGAIASRCPNSIARFWGEAFEIVGQPYGLAQNKAAIHAALPRRAPS